MPKTAKQRNDWLSKWQTRLREPLPGRRAHRLMEPDLSFGRHSDPPLFNARRAAVMVLFYRRGGRWHIPLTVRPPELADHAGQICLPGGAIEPGESTEEAALRELREELGVPPHAVELLGRLSPLNLFVSNFLVTPSVGVAPEPVKFAPNAGEVAELIELPVEVLLDPAARGRGPIPGRAIPLSAPYYSYQGHTIWGATSMVLREVAMLWDELG